MVHTPHGVHHASFTSSVTSSFAVMIVAFFDFLVTSSAASVWLRETFGTAYVQTSSTRSTATSTQVSLSTVASTRASAV